MDTVQPSDNWQLGNPYERYVGRWSRRVAPAFLSWLDAPAGKRWLDVGCGTGALCAAIAEHCAPTSITGVEPSEGFLRIARETLAGRVRFCPGNAADIPLEDAAVDVVVSGLVLNFVPNPGAAFKEIARVATRGAMFGAYVWDYAGKMELMRYFWDAAVALDPGAARLDEGLRFPICRPDVLIAEVGNAGFREPEVTSIDVPTFFPSFQDYWEPFLGGQGPAPSYAMSLDEPARSKLRDRIRQTLPVQADGSISLVARAWAVRATV
ncbi:class I SAM-dependent methyltransferase [Polaromonas sp. AER18D-145]|uniref:class I SAM-dependent methyltransferase n=1 Tax=Polaromonas sp. AER18D-145 TaxID=1977060 RepID=UPI000BBB7B16|nr:class I SAM-dependent methyltransferase [Polaromonas sp. AER18D-145]